MGLQEFEDKRWSEQNQKVFFRHTAAANMVLEGTVLDLGCGDGLFLQLLGQRGIVGEGLDISPEGVKKCAAKGIKAQAFDFANRPLPYADNTFDTVVMLDVLEHLYFPLKVLEEARRVSKKFIIIGVPNFNSLPARVQVLRGVIPENNRPGQGHVFWFNYLTLKRVLRDARLEIVMFNSNTFWQGIPLVRWLTRGLLALRPSIFALSFVVKARKI